MSLKPQAARWFELLVPRESLSAALSVLSRTRAVQLQARSDDGSPQGRQLSGDLARGLAHFGELRQRYGTWWRNVRADARLLGASAPEQRLQNALHEVENWIAGAESHVAALESLETEQHRLAALARYLEIAAARTPRPDWLAQAGPRIQVRLIRDRRHTAPLVVPDNVIVQRIADGDAACFLLIVGTRPAVDELQRALPAGDTELIPLPRWLPAEPDAAKLAVQQRLDALSRQLTPLRAELEALASSAALQNALGDIAFVDWFAAQVPQLDSTGRLAWITGWCLAARDAALGAALHAAAVPHLIRFTAAPAGLEAPVSLLNPRWAAPFEFFVDLMGTPGSEEADPSILLAVIAPILFGFMFADIGQGAVLLLAGLALRRRYPMLALLVPGGIASMTFGALFGSVFAREDLFEALWLRPFDAPMAVLAAALALGVFIIATGFAVDAFSHFGAGLGARWLRRRAGLVLLYAGAVVVFWRPMMGAVLALLGLLVSLAGALAEGPAGQRLATLGQMAGELVETALQLAVNTVSFVRVGAFALAHCGLSVAIVGLADAAQSRFSQLLILVLGNAFVLVLEALVVGIQTTRLVLFEFFIRFLRGTGRAFRPLPDAPLSAMSGPGGHS